MIVTMLTARVREARIDDLERAYREAVEELPPDIVETFLLRGAMKTDEFRIVTVWSSRAALEAMRSSGSTPKGVLIFREAGAEPELTLLEVVNHRRREDASRL